MKNWALIQMLKILAKAGVCITITIVCLGVGLCQTKDVPVQSSPQSVSDMVAGLYSLVSSTAGKLPDWDKVRACFLKEAVVVLRTSRSSTSVFSLEGFIKDFVDFYERPFKIGDKALPPKDTGFTERVVRLKAWEYGDMAHVLVLYEAQITGRAMPPQQGVDSWLLVKRDGRWLIAAVTNEVVAPTRPVPPELRADDTASQQTPDLATLKAQFEQETKAGNKPHALEAAEQIVGATELEHYEALYRAASLHAELGHRDKAYRFLARAIAAGFYDRARILQDDSFKEFRGKELFRSLARRAWANGYVGLFPTGTPG